MWAFAMRHPKARLNEMVMAWHIHGPLDIDALRAAVDDLALRHPTLRSVLRYEGGQLYQVALPLASVTFAVTDSRGGSLPQQLDTALAAINASDEVVDVLRGPTTRAHLYRLDSHDHVFCLRVHHAMCDGWSIHVLLNDLGAIYEGRRTGSPSGLAPLTSQLADVAQWEIEACSKGGFDDELRYWRAELATPPAPLSLPAIGPRHGNRDWRARIVQAGQSKDAFDTVRTTARRLKVSPFALLLSAFSTVLHHRTGAEDQLLGVPTLNRWSEDVMHVVGYATSLMPIRLHPRPATRFDALCTQVHSATHKMLAYGRVPLEILLRETDLSTLGANVFPVWCQYIPTNASSTAHVGGLEFRSLATERHSMLAELDLDMYGSDAGLLCEFGYRTALFEPSAIQAIVDDFFAVIRSGTSQPSITVGELARGLA